MSTDQPKPYRVHVQLTLSRQSESEILKGAHIIATWSGHGEYATIDDATNAFNAESRATQAIVSGWGLGG